MDNVQIKIFPRKLARQMTRSEFERAKVTGYNRKRRDFQGNIIGSEFSSRWREIAAQVAARPMPKKKTKKKGMTVS